MKNPLHKKKLQLALQAMNSGNMSKAGDLDHTWVMRKFYICSISSENNLYFDERTIKGYAF